VLARKIAAFSTVDKLLLIFRQTALEWVRQKRKVELSQVGIFRKVWLMSQTYKSRRITDILLNHWNDARGERMFPSKEQINELELQKDGVWGDIFIIDIFPLIASNGYRFSYMGQNIGHEFSNEVPGKFVKNIVVGFLENTSEKYNMVAEQKRPVQQEEIFKSHDGMVIKYRQILLPLGPDDDSPVTSIIGGMRYIVE
jgi:hypothetical protein